MGRVKELYYSVNERYSDNIDSFYDCRSILDDYAFEEIDEEDGLAS